METKIYTITDLERDHEKIVEAAEIIRNGGLVAFPTDTVYALGASLESEEAILKLFEVKTKGKSYEYTGLKRSGHASLYRHHSA